ncbi:cysteine--tRNA ligase [Candidatus Gottesmanbacteria bacterium]|nr:cysteine--tRNA ligase [Candidatus Gottesmanbacteria bacterium]
MLKLYNTLTRKIEPFNPIKPPRVGMYSCGPTVYDFQHIGNLRTYTNTDILKRVLSLNGYDVFQVMNITDVGHLTSNEDTGEDKMEKGARREGKSVWEIAKFYTEDFFDSLKKLNIKPANVISRATDHIKEMIDLIRALELKGYTYRIGDGVYFDTSRLRDYGKLARLDTKGLKAGARIEVVAGKKHPTDFALWKFSEADSHRQMEWDSPWGKGFPGWHIECSAMSLKYLGNTFENNNFHGERSRTIDVHSGGVDHIPVHHTNEIAQSEVATGKPFAKYWVHFAHLLVSGQKMSKSLGNFYTKDDIENRGFDLLDLRYLYLNTHYRSTMNFTWKSITGAKRALGRLKQKIANYKLETLNSKFEKKKKMSKNDYQNRFITAINTDLNIPEALAVTWEMVDDSKVTNSDKLNMILEFDKVFGLGLGEKIHKEKTIPQEIMILVKKREDLRAQKEWAKSDEVRIKIENKGYVVEDTESGTKVKSVKT